MPVARILVVPLLTLALPGPANAQAIQGRVRDLVTLGAVPGAVVTLTRDEAVLRRVLTGEDGHFALDNVPEGALSLEVEALGYATRADRTVAFDGQPLFLEIGLEPAPVGTEGVVVTVQAQKPHLRAEGYYQRLQRGHGDFVTPDDIARLTPLRPSDLLRRVPSIRLIRGEEPVIGRSSRSTSLRGPCRPILYVDGVVVRLARPDVPFNSVIPPPEHIEAIEVYPGGASVPAQWRNTGSACGVIVVWTKH